MQKSNKFCYFATKNKTTGIWNTGIKDNDTFLEIYQRFFDLYNQGDDPSGISKKVLEDFKDLFDDYDDRNDSLFGLASAQWETKSLNPGVFKEVKEIIESGKEIARWKELGADEKTLKKRALALNRFLTQISTEKAAPKRRVRSKFEFSSIQLIRIVAPDSNKVFEANEYFTNGLYVQTGSGISWPTGGGSVFYFIGQGKSITAIWIDSQTLEVTHDQNIIFTKKEETFYFCGDHGIIIYIPK